MTNTNPLTARLATVATAQLELIVRELYSETAENTPERRMVAAAAADELSRRWDIEPELDRVFLDDEFTGSYYEAMLIARESRHRFTPEAP